MRVLIPLVLSGLLSPSSSDAAAQVPPGWGAYSRLYCPCVAGLPQSSPSGVTIFEPYVGTSLCPPGGPFATSFVRVTGPGLPPALAVAGGTAIAGANSVLVDDSDGSVFVGQSTDTGSVAIYHLTLAGSTATAFRSYTLGALRAGAALGHVDQMAWLPGGLILFSHRGVTGPAGIPLPSQGIAILDPTSGVVIPIPTPPFPQGGTINAVAADRAGTTGYIGVFLPPGAVPRSFVYSVPLPGGGAIATVGSLADGIYQLDVDHDGLIYASLFRSGLSTLDPTTGVATTVDPTSQLNAMTIDRVSGDVWFAGMTQPAMFRWSPTIGRVAVPGMPPAGQPPDVASGLAIRSNMLAVGAQSGGGPTTPAFDWVTAPNPGGAPLVGNRAFSLTMSTTATPIMSGIFFSTGVAPAPIPLPFGATLLLDPTVLIPARMIRRTGTSQWTTAVSISTNTSLCGQTWYAQSFHIIGTGLVSSPALGFTLQ